MYAYIPYYGHYDHQHKIDKKNIDTEEFSWNKMKKTKFRVAKY